MEKKIFASIKNKTSFEKSECSIEKKLENPYKYVRRQVVARFMSLYEIFKLQLNVKGSVIECGVHHGGTLMSLAKVSTILEPYNYHRKIIGFDTFSGFLNIHNQIFSLLFDEIFEQLEDDKQFDIMMLPYVSKNKLIP
jgi:hypothetical protein